MVGGAVAVAREGALEPLPLAGRRHDLGLHSAAESPPSTATLLPRSRPTMSMFSIATRSVVFRRAVGWRVKAVEPSVPSSSPEKAIR